jgi:hypothetical protein
MKNYSLILCVLFIFIFNPKITFAQSDGPGSMNDWLTNPGWEFYSVNMLSTVSTGKGNTGIAGLGDLTSITLNPASVNINRKYQVFAGSAYKSSVSYPFSRYYSLNNSFPSGIIGGIYRINENFQTGLVYRNEYGFSYELDYSTSPNINYVNKFITHNFSVPVTFNYKWLRAGIDLCITNYRGDFNGHITTEIDPEGYYDESYSSLWRFSPRIGIIITPVKTLSFGFTYEPGFSDSTTWHFNAGTPSERNSFVKYPRRLGVGTELRLLNDRLKFTLDYHLDKTGDITRLKDKNNFNIGIEYQTEDYFIIRGGFFTLLDFRDLTNTISLDGVSNYDQYFLTLGGTYKYKGYSFSLALMDSHLTKKSDVYHTKINGGISFDF